MAILKDLDFAVVSVQPGEDVGAHAAVPYAEAPADGTSVRGGSVDGSGSSEGPGTLFTHQTSYSDLSEAAKTLDLMLCSIFKMSIKGSKEALGQCVTFPSHVQAVIQAVIVLVKHNVMNISKMHRTTAAFEKLESLLYNRDTLQFPSNFLACKGEINTRRATVTHLAMCQLMKASEGKSKTVQSKIVEVFNRLNLDDSHIDLYNLVQGYCADLAIVGDSKPHRVGAVICTDCKSETHMAEDCPSHTQWITPIVLKG